MKQVIAETGGRPFANDDFLTIQAELTAAVQAQFLGKGPFILSGCHVSGAGPTYNVTSGIVCLDGQLLRFAGAGAVTLPMQFQAGTVVASDPRPYQTGGTKNCMREVPAVLVASDPAYSSGEFLPLDTWGGKRWEDVQRASMRYLGEISPLGVAGYVASDYDADGVGKPGTTAWGWALCDGRNGRDDLAGMFVVGLDPNNAEYDAVGKTGGAESIQLSVAELPVHSHGMANGTSDNNGTTGAGDTYAKSFGGSGGLDQARRTSATGSNTPHENRPPFYTVGYRQWVGY